MARTQRPTEAKLSLTSNQFCSHNCGRIHFPFDRSVPTYLKTTLHNQLVRSGRARIHGQAHVSLCSITCRTASSNAASIAPNGYITTSARIPTSDLPPWQRRQASLLFTNNLAAESRGSHLLLLFRFLEQLSHFFVARLRKLVIPNADGEEHFRL